MKLYVITGASRGLGAALAGERLAAGHRVLGMARSRMADLEQSDTGGRFIGRSVDLGDAAAAVRALEAGLAGIDAAGLEEVCLINNAGTVLPMGPARGLSPQEVAAAVALNLAAPMALTAAFLNLTARWPAACQRKVVNITSGAAHKPYQGWSVYCASKAGLDHFSRCVALEEQELAHGATVVSLAPGMMDTDMQAVVRAAAPGEFKEQARFVALKASGQLPSPLQAAHRIIAYIEGSDFGTVPVVDLRLI